MILEENYVSFMDFVFETPDDGLASEGILGLWSGHPWLVFSWLSFSFLSYGGNLSLGVAFLSTLLQ